MMPEINIFMHPFSLIHCSTLYNLMPGIQLVWSIFVAYSCSAQSTPITRHLFSTSNLSHVFFYRSTSVSPPGHKMMGTPITCNSTMLLCVNLRGPLINRWRRRGSHSLNFLNTTLAVLHVRILINRSILQSAYHVQSYSCMILFWTAL